MKSMKKDHQEKEQLSLEKGAEEDNNITRAVRMMKDTANDGVIGMKMSMNPVDMTGKDPRGEARDMRKAMRKAKERA